MHHAQGRWTWLGLTLIAVSACTDNGAPTDPARGGRWGGSAEVVSAGDAALRGLPGSIDDRMIDVANQVGGFGGVSVEGGVATVFLTDLNATAAARSAVLPLLREMEAGEVQVEVRQGAYDWRDLMRWRRRLATLMQAPGISYVDTDERINRVRIGVVDAESRALVAGALTGSSTPGEAVVVEDAEPIVTSATLQDYRRPALAGTQIAFGQFVCTLGVNTLYNGIRSFITASHCSNVQGGVEGTIYYQPTIAPANRIGVEIADPVYTTGGSCPAGRRCRNSDAAVVQYDASATSDYGFIASTVATPLYSLTYDAAPNDRFRIGGRDSALTSFSGYTMEKMGRTTGRSKGSNTSNCVDVNVSTSNVTLFCQTMVSAAAGEPAAQVGPGDSGSSVYHRLFDLTYGTTTARISGVLWGLTNNGATFIFSPWKNIETDFHVPIFVK